MRSLLSLVTLLTLAQQAACTCDDLDSTACALMHNANPALCQDMALAETACRKFCGLCPMTCYHCDANARTAADCTNMKVCAVGEKCLIAKMHSYIDDHEEYKMNCGTMDQCEGGEFLGLLGRRRASNLRSLSMECCTTDMCNSPARFVTTTTTTTTTTTPRPTTQQPTTTRHPMCFRDIEILVEDSDSQTHSETDALKAFLKHFVSTLDISPSTNEVGFALFDNTTHGSHYLQTDISSALRAIDRLPFRHSTHRVSMDEVARFLTYRTHTDLPGGRSNFDNVIIMIFDSSRRLSIGSSHFLFRTTTHSPIANTLNRISHDVIVIDVGQVQSGSSSWQHLFSGNVDQLATDSHHVLHVPDYASLSRIENQLLELLCKN